MPDIADDSSQDAADYAPAGMDVADNSSGDAVDLAPGALRGPVFPGEAQISLTAATLTSSGCTNPAAAVAGSSSMAAVFGAPGQGGGGLTGIYYQDSNFNALLTWQVDPSPSLSFLPPPLTAGSAFSVRWTGFLEVPITDNYTFYASADDGVRVYFGDVQIVLGTIAQSGVSSPVLLTAGQRVPVRVDYDNVTAPASLSLAWSTPSLPQESIPASVYFLAAAPILAVRFLRVDWGYDVFLSRLRLAYSGPGAGNAGVDYESSLSRDAGHSPPLDISLSYLPSPVDANCYEVAFDPPVLARGAVFYPDALLPGPSSQSVTLSELQVYQAVSQGNPIMPNPTTNQARVGCSGAVITPRFYTGPTSYPFPQTAASVLRSIQGLSFTEAVKLARETGGETVHQINGYETDREVKCKISVERHDYLALQNFLGGTLIVNPANGQLGETQYHAPGYTDRAPYFSLVAQSVNGDPSALFVLPKCKIDGNLTADLERDKTTMLDVDFVLFWDYNYTRQDGTVGGIYEQIFNNGGAPALHS